MKKIAKKKHYNKIAIVLLVVLLCNFLLPTCKIIASDNEISKPEGPLTLFFCAIGDILLNLLQENIVGVSGLKYAGEYELKYSPGVIFSGDLAAFDINFIHPIDPETRYKVKQEETEIAARTTVLITENATENNNSEEQENDTVAKFCTEDKLYETNMLSNCEEKQYTPNEDLIRRSDVLAYAAKLQNEKNFYDEDTNKREENININIDENFSIYSWWLRDTGEKTITKYVIYMSYSNKFQEENQKNTRIYQIKMTQTVYEKQPIAESIAGKMKDTIATWYNVSREIALVGLLCVLVYVAIRGMISGSTGDKAKYKKMLVDWLVAMIIVMTLHYIIALTLALTKAISNIFSLQVISEDGTDIIFSKLRNSIGDGDFVNNLLNTVMYYYLVFMTIKFTVLYFKRVVYMAFLTMIAPLIGLTYPLDKIKDGQAQAFTMWIREFVFNALLQPLHLILYYVFIGSSIMTDFATENPFFALVVISFLKPAEKMLRKMFGFDKAGKLGNLNDAFKGAAIMNMINKFKAMGGTGGKAHSPGNAGSETIRTTNTTTTSDIDNPYAALVESDEQVEQQQIEQEIERQLNQQQLTQQQLTQQQLAQQRINRKTKSQQKKLEHQRRMEAKRKAQQRNKGGSSNGGVNYTGSQNARQVINNSRTNGVQTRNSAATSSPKTNKVSSGLQTKRDIKKPSIIKRASQNHVIRGVASVGVKTLKSVTRGTIRGGVKVAGMAALGTVGLAAGLATGEIENAFVGAAGGIAAGSKIGGNIANRAIKTRDQLVRTGNDLKQTYDNGRYGEKEAERKRKVREFKQTKEYRNLLEKFAGSQKKIDKYIDAGIMDVSKIRIALTNNYSVDNNIAYMNMAKLCPAEIFEDRDKFNTYLESHGIPKTNADEIYKAVRKFK